MPNKYGMHDNARAEALDAFRKLPKKPTHSDILDAFATLIPLAPFDREFVINQYATKLRRPAYELDYIFVHEILYSKQVTINVPKEKLMGVPHIHVVFETEDENVTGTTSAKIKRIEINDDGSYTAVIDHWPKD